MGSGGMYQLLAEGIQQRRATLPFRRRAPRPSTPRVGSGARSRRPAVSASTSVGASTRTTQVGTGRGVGGRPREHPGVVGAQRRRPPLLHRALVEDVHAGARRARRTASRTTSRFAGRATRSRRVGLAAAQPEVRRDREAAAARHAARDDRALPPDARPACRASARSAPSPPWWGRRGAAATRRAHARSSTSLHRAGRRTRRRCPRALQAGPDRAQDRGEHLVGGLRSRRCRPRRRASRRTSAPARARCGARGSRARPRADGATRCRRRRRAGSTRSGGNRRASSYGRSSYAASRRCHAVPSAQCVSRGPSSSPANCICGQRSQITTMPRVRAFITWRSLRFFSAASVTAHSAFAAPIAPGMRGRHLGLLGDRALVARRSEHEVTHELHRLAEQGSTSRRRSRGTSGRRRAWARGTRASRRPWSTSRSRRTRRTRRADRRRYRPGP